MSDSDSLISVDQISRCPFFLSRVHLPVNFFSFLNIRSLLPLASMTKKKAPGKKKQKFKELSQINNVPIFTKIPRKTPPMAKRSSSSSCPDSRKAPGSLPECSYDRDEASSVTLTSFNDNNNERKKLHDSVNCRKSWDKRQGFVLNSYEFPVTEVEAVALNKVSDPWSDRIVQTVVEQKGDTKKLEVAGSNGVCKTPGNVVWAKTTCQVWWPAEIIGKRYILADSKIQQTEEQVLVKFYGKHKSAWVNATRDLSMLEDCFEERSCNQEENFQDALKQALVQRKEHIKSCGKLAGTPDSSTHHDLKDQKSELDFGEGKHTSSTTSSKTESNVVKQGGSKKDRKPKVDHNEAKCPSTSAKGVRRVKIMRNLGLTAPIGSPF